MALGVLDWVMLLAGALFSIQDVDEGYRRESGSSGTQKNVLTEGLEGVFLLIYASSFSLKAKQMWGAD